MSVYSDFPSFQAVHEGCVATIGKYDGLHSGHQHVLATLCRTAKDKGLPAVVILSEPHPEEFFSGGKAAPRLTQFQDKVDYLLAYGVDAVYMMTFDKALCELSAKDFILQYLVEGLRVSALIVGDDFRFGKNRKGDFRMLKEKGSEYGFEVIREIPFKQEGHRVSSTLVKSFLEQGECEKVRSLLGRYYSIAGLVEEGKKLGRELGTPTANIALSVNSLPLQGIFSVLVEHKGQSLPGVASVGFNPTVENSETPKLEVHIFDFDEDIYGEHLVVSFINKLRDEIAFPDLDALKTQMNIDIEQARKTLQSL
ncbi:MAG: riboflavin kinase/FMN adenylyltransferase [Pseudohongiellaceae bacterium]|jgi:riboflavin kinase/FMN adenylyltransferase